MKSAPIHIVVADDHSIMREGLIAVINQEPDMEVVGQASDWPEAVEQVAQKKADIAILDLHMRGMEPADGVVTMRKMSPAAKIIIFSAFSTDEEVYQVLRAGARGYVLKGECGREDLLACIHAVSKGELWIHPFAAARLAQRMTAQTLTSREMEILRLMAMGKSNKDIGSALDVTEGTVKVHVNHILAKMGVGGRIEAVLAAVQRGLVHLVESPVMPNANQENPSPHPPRGDAAVAAASSSTPVSLKK